MPTRRLLFIAHELTLTGAPMNLLHLQRWLAEHADVEIHTLALAPGALAHRFEEVGPVTMIDRWAPEALLGAVQSGLQHLGSRNLWKPIAAARLYPQLRRFQGYDLVYCNSISSASILPYLPRARVTAVHAHELQVAYRVWRHEDQKRAFRELPDRWIAASGAVVDLLVDEIGLPNDKVLLHYEFIDAASISSRSFGLREIEARRHELNIPSNAAVVVGAGTVDWRKGADLFVQLACEVRRQTREPVHFVWVGGDLRSGDWERVRSDRDRAGADHVHFVGVKPDPMPWFALADVFALTSREDPFPLVALECAAMGKPIVTYRNGGIPELLNAAGPEARLGIVDHLDVRSMAERIIALLDTDTLHRAAASQLRARVLEAHDVSVAAPRLWADLERLMR